jgi:hypothetical protein
VSAPRPVGNDGSAFRWDCWVRTLQVAILVSAGWQVVEPGNISSLAPQGFASRNSAHEARAGAPYRSTRLGVRCALGETARRTSNDLLDQEEVLYILVAGACNGDIDDFASLTVALD